MEYKINTSIPIRFEKLEEIPDSRFLKVKIWLCHTLDNLNGSFFSKDLLETMKNESLANIPILGYISKDNLNESDFNGHEERLIIENGEIKIEYIGKIYGLIPETHNAKFEMKLCDDGIEREYLTCEGLLYTRFPECIDIFNRDEVKGQSMELESSSISGKFESDNLFHFETAKFEGACILGDSLTPAMVNSTIEKFSINTIKNQLQEMIVELNNTVFNKNNQEGGKYTLNEKFELIKNYENLTEEDVADLKLNHEQYSLEDFDKKLKELSDAKNTIPSTDFTLTHEQLEDEIRKVLRTETVVTDDWWGEPYEEQKYYYRDIKDNIIIVESYQWYTYFGIPFTTNNDSVVLDFENMSEYLYDWRPKIEGEVVNNFAKADYDTKLELFKKKAIEKAKESFDVKETNEYKELSTNYEKLKISNDDTTIKFEALKIENSTLEKFKSDTEKQQQEAFEKHQKELKDELIENFSKILTAEEIKSVEDKNLSVEDMEKEFKLMFASKELPSKFSSKKEKDKKTEVPITKFKKTNEDSWTSCIKK